MAELIVERDRSFRSAVRLLRQYEPWRSLGRIAVAGFLAVAPWCVAVAGTTAGIYLAADLERVYLVALAAIFAVGSSAISTAITRRRPWRRLIERRLWSYERPNPAAWVPVLIPHNEIDRSWVALRRAKLNPVGTTRVGAPPPDAPTLTAKIDVMEPADWPCAPSDKERAARVATVFRREGIRARVSGLDVGGK